MVGMVDMVDMVDNPKVLSTKPLTVLPMFLVWHAVRWRLCFPFPVGFRGATRNGNVSDDDGQNILPSFINICIRSRSEFPIFHFLLGYLTQTTTSIAFPTGSIRVYHRSRKRLFKLHDQAYSKHDRTLRHSSSTSANLSPKTTKGAGVLAGPPAPVITQSQSTHAISSHLITLVHFTLAMCIQYYVTYPCGCVIYRGLEECLLYWEEQCRGVHRRDENSPHKCSTCRQHIRR